MSSRRNQWCQAHAAQRVTIAIIINAPLSFMRHRSQRILALYAIYGVGMKSLSFKVCYYQTAPQIPKGSPKVAAALLAEDHIRS